MAISNSPFYSPSKWTPNAFIFLGVLAQGAGRIHKNWHNFWKCKSASNNSKTALSFKNRTTKDWNVNNETFSRGFLAKSPSSSVATARAELLPPRQLAAAPSTAPLLDAVHHEGIRAPPRRALLSLPDIFSLPPSLSLFSPKPNPSHGGRARRRRLRALRADRSTPPPSPRLPIPPRARNREGKPGIAAALPSSSSVAAACRGSSPSPPPTSVQSTPTHASRVSLRFSWTSPAS